MSSFNDMQSVSTKMKVIDRLRIDLVAYRHHSMYIDGGLYW